MEEQLHKEFLELGQRGVKVKGWWFKTRARQILEAQSTCTTTDSNQSHTFKFSLGWFTRFKARHRISLRKPTNTAQKPPNEKEEAINKFHQ